MNKQNVNFKKVKAALNFGLPTNKLTLNNINHVYAACKMSDGPLPPMNMYVKPTDIYYIDGSCPLKVEDYVNLFSSKSSINKIKQIVNKLNISYDQTNKITKQYLVTIVKKFLKQSGVIEPIRIPLRVPKSSSPVAVTPNLLNQNTNRPMNNMRTPNQNLGNQNVNRNLGNQNTNQRTPNQNLGNLNREQKIQNIKNKLRSVGANTQKINVPIGSAIGQSASMFGGALRSVFNVGTRAAASAASMAGSAARQTGRTGRELSRAAPKMRVPTVNLPRLRSSNSNSNMNLNMNKNDENNNADNLGDKINSALKSI
jgi:hypothetical protein